MPQLLIPKHPLLSKRNRMILEAFDSGMSRAQVAQKFKLSPCRVDQIRREYRGRHGKTPVKLSKAQRELVKLEWEAGISRAATASFLGVYPCSLKRINREFGLKPRPHGFQPKAIRPQDLKRREHVR